MSNRKHFLCHHLILAFISPVADLILVSNRQKTNRTSVKQSKTNGQDGRIRKRTMVAIFKSFFLIIFKRLEKKVFVFLAVLSLHSLSLTLA